MRRTVQHLLLCQPVNIHAIALILADGEVGDAGREEIGDGLVVDLQAAAAAAVAERVAALSRCCGLDLRELVQWEKQ